MEQINEPYKWNNLINIQLLIALFYAFSGAVMARRTENNVDNVIIFVAFVGAIILGLMGYGQSITQFKQDNKMLTTIVFLSLAVWSHTDVLKNEHPNSYRKIIIGTVIGTITAHYMWQIT